MKRFYKKNPNKKEYIAQCRLSLDILWSKGAFALPEYKEVIRELASAVRRAESDNDGI